MNLCSLSNHLDKTKYNATSTKFPPKMSRFFRGASDSESSSSDEQELYSEEDEEKSEESSSEESSSSSSSEDEVSEEEGEAEGGSQFIKGGKYEESDESEDEGRRVVRSARDKRLGEIESSIRLIENAEKINDWVVITVGWFLS